MESRKKNWSGTPPTTRRVAKRTGGVKYDPVRFLASSKSKWCGWDSLPAQFLASGQRASGEPERPIGEFMQLSYFSIKLNETLK